jgi:lysophospholipase L1-like esterase
MARILLRLVVAIIGILTALTAAELALRRLHPRSDDFWQAHPILGQTHRPGATGVFRSRCYEVPIAINAQGFRGPERTPSPAPGTIRIVAVGDSMTEAFQVPYPETFTGVLERNLNAAGKRFEIVNLGVSSYGTTQSYLNLLHRGFTFEPKFVVLGFSLTDVRDDSRELEGRADKPYFVREGDRLVLQPFSYRPRYEALKSAVRRLQLYQRFGSRLATGDWTRSLLQRVGLAERLTPDLEDEVRQRPAGGMSSVFSVYAKDYPPVWRAALELETALLGKVHADAASRGAALVVLGFPHPVELMSTAELDARYPRFRPDHDVDQLQRMLAAAAKQHGFRHLPLAPAFRAAIANGTPLSRLFACDDHFSAEGHRVIAAALAEALR